MYTIYGLTDPRDNKTHYVGITDDVYKRFIAHISGGAGSNYEKNAWVHEMRVAGVMIHMDVLEQTEDSGYARIRERYWISHFLTLRHPLTNKVYTHPHFVGKVLVRSSAVRSAKAAISVVEADIASRPEIDISQPVEQSGDAPVRVLAKDDQVFTPEQERDFILRFSKSKSIKKSLRQMVNARGRVGLSNRYYRYAKWVIERDGLREGE